MSADKRRAYEPRGLLVRSDANLPWLWWLGRSVQIRGTNWRICGVPWHSQNHPVPDTGVLSPGNPVKVPHRSSRCVVAVFRSGAGDGVPRHDITIQLLCDARCHCSESYNQQCRPRIRLRDGSCRFGEGAREKELGEDVESYAVERQA